MYYKYYFAREKNNGYVTLVNIYSFNQRNKYYNTSFIFLSVLRHVNMVCFWRKKSFYFVDIKDNIIVLIIFNIINLIQSYFKYFKLK